MCPYNSSKLRVIWGYHIVCFILYKKQNQVNVTFCNFVDQVAQSWLNHQPVENIDTQRDPINYHIPIKTNSQRRCRESAKQKSKRTTIFECNICKCALHPGLCFVEYHKTQ